MIAIDPNTPVEYVVLSDRGSPPENQTVFLLKPLTLREEGDVARALQRDQHEGALLLLSYGLRGWRGLVDRDGNEVAFDLDAKKGQPTRECLGRLPVTVRTELAMAIQAGCRLDEDERGK